MPKLSSSDSSPDEKFESFSDFSDSGPPLDVGDNCVVVKDVVDGEVLNLNCLNVMGLKNLKLGR